MDVGDWLRQLELERYESAFCANEVSAAILPSLTSDDLKHLGVTSADHRHRLLQAIAILRCDAMRSTDQGPTSPVDQLLGSAAERRQLSVMFCDLIEFTALSSRLDPEDLSAVIRGYQSRVTSTISRFGGFIARYVGEMGC